MTAEDEITTIADQALAEVAELRLQVAQLRAALAELLALARAQVLPTPGRAEVLDAAERALATSARWVVPAFLVLLLQLPAAAVELAVAGGPPAPPPSAGLAQLAMGAAVALAVAGGRRALAGQGGAELGETGKALLPLVAALLSLAVASLAPYVPGLQVALPGDAVGVLAAVATLWLVSMGAWAAAKASARWGRVITGGKEPG